MSALKKEGSERVRAGDAVGMIDCGRASKRTKGLPIGLWYEVAAMSYSLLPF